jgi:hypothetical protein
MLIATFLAFACGFADDQALSYCAPIEFGTAILTAEDSLEIRARPDSLGPVWSVLPPGESIEIWAIDADGWLGFDPGVAQAGNSGSFRYRWVAPVGPYVLQGCGDRLRPVWGPSSTSCYVMTFDPVLIYLDPDSLSLVVDSLPGSSAAAIVDYSPGWFRIDPVDGPDPGVAPGWVSQDCVSINGELPYFVVVQEN